MNILFYTTFEVSPNKGGIERITTTIATDLERLYGFSCFSAYGRPIDELYLRTPFKDKILIYVSKEYERMAEFLQDHQIDVIINQSDFNQSFHFRQIINQYHLSCKLVFAHHFSPHSEIDRFPEFIKFAKLQDWKGIHFIKSFVHLVKYKHYKKQNEDYYKDGYQKTCLYSDRIVLLSSGFINDFEGVAGVKCRSKISIIHNALSYPSFFNLSDYGDKKHEVLIVSRLEEYQKRLSSALRIWARIEQENIASTWMLRIVGTGENEQDYKRYVAKHSLKRVIFEGVKDALPEYQSASIFMMTSRSEGFGLTLTEAQQNACVPLVFNSYASVYDIVTDGKDGFIIEDEDEETYFQKLVLLMTDDELRRKMALSAVAKSHLFEKEIIVKQWYEMLKSMN